MKKHLFEITNEDIALSYLKEDLIDIVDIAIKKGLNRADIRDIMKSYDMQKNFEEYVKEIKEIRDEAK